MKKEDPNKDHNESYLLDISDDDILEAMKEIEGYLDITFSDFRELYHSASRYALERLMNLVKAKDIMTKEVIRARKDTPLTKVAEAMASHGISGVPVVENDGQVIGIISEKDFLVRIGSESSGSCMDIIARYLKNKGCVAAPMRQQHAGEIMTIPVITVNEDTPVSEIMNIFSQRKVNRVPVLDQEMKLTGIITRADALRGLPFGEKARP